jgi:DNA-binding MarR family transcriptional regulator
MPLDRPTEEPGVGELGELIQRLARVTRHLEFAQGLNPAQWDALRYLARANAMSRTPGALAEFLAVTKGTASQTVMALEGKGLLTRVKEDGDRRVVRLALTALGEALIEQDPLARLRQAATDLPADQAAIFAMALRRVLGRVADGPATFGHCRNCGHHLSADGAARCALVDKSLALGEPDKICVNFREPALSDAPPSAS